MTSKLHSHWAISGIKVIDVDILEVGSTRELMATMRKFNFLASLDRQRLEAHYRPAQYVAKQNLVLECNDDMQSTWMEGNRQAFFLESLGDLMGASLVVPNADGLVL